MRERALDSVGENLGNSLLLSAIDKSVLSALSFQSKAASPCLLFWLPYLIPYIMDHLLDHQSPEQPMQSHSSGGQVDSIFKDPSFPYRTVHKELVDGVVPRRGGDGTVGVGEERVANLLDEDVALVCSGTGMRSSEELLQLLEEMLLLRSDDDAQTLPLLPLWHVEIPEEAED